MPYYVPPVDQLRAGFVRTNKKYLWDGISPMTPGKWAFYRTEDYVMPALHKTESAAAATANFSVVPETEILSAHEGYIKIRDTLTQLGLIGGTKDDDDAITFTQANSIYDRLMRLGSAHNEMTIMNFHLLRGKVENYSKVFGRRPEDSNESSFEVDVFLSSITQIFQQSENVLREYGIEPTPSNTRKLFIFQAANKLLTKDGWLTHAPNFAGSVMRFIRAGAPLSMIMRFHRSRGARRDFLGIFEAHPSTTTQAVLTAEPSAVCIPMTEYEVNNLTQLPAALVRELYSEGCMLYNGSEEKYLLSLEESGENL